MEHGFKSENGSSSGSCYVVGGKRGRFSPCRGGRGGRESRGSRYGPSPGVHLGANLVPLPEQLVQRDADILLIKLLSIIRAAGIPAVTAQRRIMARDAQLVHRAIHRLKQLVRGSFV